MQIMFNGFEITGTPSEVFEFVNMKDVKAKPVEVPKEKPKAVAKSKPKQNKRVELDLGKVRALREGGWSVAAIADEMRVSEPTIRARLKEMSA